MGRIPGSLGQFFVGTLHVRRVQRVLHRPHLIHFSGQPIGIFHHDLIRLFFTQKRKLLEHIISRAEWNVRPARTVKRIGTALRIDQNVTIDFVFRIKVVRVASCHDRLVHICSQLDHVFDNVF